MVERRTLARPYAKALFALAKENKCFEKWSEALTLFTLVASASEMLTILRDNTIEWQTMAELFWSIVERMADKTSYHLIQVLAYNRRLEILPEIKELFEEMRAIEENYIDVELMAPTVLNDREESHFREILEKIFLRTVKLKCKINQNLMGGFIARAGNDVIDGSLQGQLINLKKVMGDAL